jgi:hypothetical protein
MSATLTIDHDPEAVGTRKVDAMRGTMNSRVSQQWFSRPDDQRFLSIPDLQAFLARRTVGMKEDVVAAKDLRIAATPGDLRNLFLEAPDGGEPLAPTNIAFQQMCGLAGAPYSYMRGKPAFLTAINLMDDYRSRRELDQKMYWNENDRELRAFTGENYGRILDESLAESVYKIAGNGTGDTCWKVPGVMNWSDSTYNPYVDVTKETTTLFASDRDVFMFLVDDTHPIEIGKLKNGDPDLIFRGFFAWNSEVGTRSLGIATFMLRGVCQNRCLWGVEDFNEMTIRHTRFAPERFARDAEPALARYASSDPTKLLAGINAAKQAVAATDDEERVKFLRSLDFSKATSTKIIETVEREEGIKPKSAWDFVQGITALARTNPNQDIRLDMEKVASRVMDRATRAV